MQLRGLGSIIKCFLLPSLLVKNVARIHCCVIVSIVVVDDDVVVSYTVAFINSVQVFLSKKMDLQFNSRGLTFLIYLRRKY